MTTAPVDNIYVTVSGARGPQGPGGGGGEGPTTSPFGAALIIQPDAPSAQGVLGLGQAAVANIGTVSGTVAAGDDSRITGAAQTSLGNTFSAAQHIALADGQNALYVINTTYANKSWITYAKSPNAVDTDLRFYSSGSAFTGDVLTLSGVNGMIRLNAYGAGALITDGSGNVTASAALASWAPSPPGRTRSPA